MNQNFYQQLVQASPLGYAYHKIICDTSDVPCDYQFIEVNPAFERITGLKACDIINKNVTEVLPGITDDAFNWVETYGKIALMGGNIEFRQFSEPLQQWFQVKAFSLEKGYFITQFSEITDEMNQLSDMHLLATIAERLLSATSLDFQEETDSIRTLVGSTYSALYLYTTETENAVQQACSSEFNGPTSLQEFSLPRTYWKKQTPESPTIQTYPSLSAHTGNKRKVILVRIGTPSQMLGYFIHIIPSEKDFKKHHIVEIHARQFGLALFQEMTQKQLRKELDFTIALFKSLPGFLYVYDEQGHLIRWNKAHETLTGYSETELTTMTLDKWYDDDDLKRVLSAVHQVFETGFGEVEARLIKKDGKKIFAHSNGVLFSMEGKKYFVGIGTDITEKRRNEDALRESEQQFRRAIEQAPIPIILHAEDGEVLNISQTWTELTGYSITDFPTINDCISDMFIDDQSTIKAMASSLYTLRERQYDGCRCITTKSGKKLRWDFYSASLGKLQDGRKIAMSVGMDITERMQLELALKDERELLKTTLLSVGDGIISTDLHGNIVYINKIAETLTGWTQETAAGKSINKVFNIINEQTRLPSENIVQQVIDSKKVLEIANHTILIAQDGREMPIEDSAAPILRKNGEVSGAVLVFRDFTEKKKRNEEILFISYHDHLTGLFNRRYFEQYMQKIQNEGHIPVSLLMADINGLKLVNDAFGYKSGDRLIQKTATILKQECGEQGIVARIGGDEFVILFPNIGELEATTIQDHIKKTISESNFENMILSVSLGLGCKTDRTEDLKKLYKEAESNLYKHKVYESLSQRSRTIDLITSTLFEKSYREMAHSKRVSEICKLIATQMSFSAEAINRMRIAGLMHDIGKIGVSEQILNKPANLDETEWEQMKNHPEIGYRILLSTPEYSEIAEYILAHHERWDGKGYPRGLSGEAIPLEARIIAVADSYDAMITTRTYKKGLDKEEAIDELQRCSGTQFDPAIVSVLIASIQNNPKNFDTEKRNTPSETSF